MNIYYRQSTLEHYRDILRQALTSNSSNRQGDPRWLTATAVIINDNFIEVYHYNTIVLVYCVATKRPFITCPISQLTITTTRHINTCLDSLNLDIRLYKRDGRYRLWNTETDQEVEYVPDTYTSYAVTAVNTIEMLKWLHNHATYSLFSDVWSSAGDHLWARYRSIEDSYDLISFLGQLDNLQLWQLERYYNTLASNYLTSQAHQLENM